jgi:rod shape-determining protein MreB
MPTFMEKLRRMIGGDPVYVRIRSNSISLRDLSTGSELEDEPVVALSKSPKPIVLGVGRGAEAAAMLQRVPFVLQRPFAHPRSLISDFLIAEKLLQQLVRRLIKGKPFRASPVMIIHPLEKLEGGLTQIEARAFQELAAATGAREAHVWVGRELQDHELRAKTFKQEQDPAGALSLKTKKI